MNLNLTEITTSDQYQIRIKDIIESLWLVSDPIERARNFTTIMNKARELDCEDFIYTASQEIYKRETGQELWELPKPFEKEVALQGVSASDLPTVLSDYLTAIARNVQVVPEMVVLPMFSALSVCVQGKALIKFPGSSHTEPLNLYTLTVAQPGERKSGVFSLLTSPLFEYQKQENERRRNEIADYQAQKRYLEGQLTAETKGKNANPERAKEIARELDNLKPVYPLTLNVTDVTPEALAWAMLQNKGIMGILDDEGGIFDILCGLYSGGICNIDLFLKAYDGSPYTVIRRTKENIELENPLLTFGIMAQPTAFEKALENPQFIGRGLIHRFMFAFPESKAGERKATSPEIPQEIKHKYDELAKRLLSLPKCENAPIIHTNKSADNIFYDYYHSIEERLKDGGMFEYMREWANKQYARCLRIAGILHLCEHSINEPLNELTAFRSINISTWIENHAFKAFGGVAVEDETTKNAKYILSKIKSQKMSMFTKCEVLRVCRKFKKVADIEELLILLEDMNYIKEVSNDDVLGMVEDSYFIRRCL